MGTGSKGGLSAAGGFFANADFDYEARIVLTFVMTNGSDGSLPGRLGYGGAEALKRGCNVLPGGSRP